RKKSKKRCVNSRRFNINQREMGLTQNANAFWDQPPLFCLKYRRIALFSGRIESPKPLPPKEGRFFYET
ncbi:hypothetical protein P4506_10320, partial [Geobacillus stearothermophilus]|uniref:hypothetical protein n=1 Tax=Geobacillus stearothermophilus TaxID=1422 RepID=UPI0030CA11D6